MYDSPNKRAEQVPSCTYAVIGSIAIAWMAARRILWTTLPLRKVQDLAGCMRPRERDSVSRLMLEPSTVFGWPLLS